jgi:hypothetical protein
MIDIRFFHLPEELAGIGREGFDITTLTFGENGIEGQGRLAGTGKPCQYNQFVTRDIDIVVLEIVFASAADAYEVGLRQDATLGFDWERTERNVARKWATGPVLGCVYWGDRTT